MTPLPRGGLCGAPYARATLESPVNCELWVRVKLSYRGRQAEFTLGSRGTVSFHADSHAFFRMSGALRTDVTLSTTTTRRGPRRNVLE